MLICSVDNGLRALSPFRIFKTLAKPKVSKKSKKVKSAKKLSASKANAAKKRSSATKSRKKTAAAKRTAKGKAVSKAKKAVKKAKNAKKSVKKATKAKKSTAKSKSKAAKKTKAKVKSTKKSSKKSTAKRTTRSSTVKKSTSRRSAGPSQSTRTAGGRSAPATKKRARGIGSRKVTLAPDDQPVPKTRLSDTELKEFERLLLAKRAELVGDVEHLTYEALGSDHTSGSSTIPLHMADMGSDNWEQEFTLGLIDNERALVREIDDALDRVVDKTYGVCIATHLPISKSRLRAKPWAKYCVEFAILREQGRLPS